MNQFSQIDVLFFFNVNFLTLTQQFDDFSDVDAENVEQQKINDDFDESVDKNLKATIEKIIEFEIVSFLNSNSIFFLFSQ